MGKIGFRQNADPEEEKTEKTELTSDNDVLNLFKEHVETSYQPFGKTEDKVFKTSQELIYEMDGIVKGVTTAQLAKVMHDAGYRIEHLGGIPYWVLYDVTHNDELNF